MNYSLLIYEPVLDDYKKQRLDEELSMFVQDERCTQIVVGCTSDWILKLSTHPTPKTMWVQMPKTNYSSLLTGLKAISEEMVLVIHLEQNLSMKDIDVVLENLNQYPAIYKNDSLQGFDTRLLMFSLQLAIELNYAVDSYGDVVKLASTPLRYI